MTVGDPRKRAERPDRKGPLGDPVAFAFLNEVGIIEQLARNRFEAVMPDDLLLSHFTVLNHLVRLGDGRSPADLARAFQLAKGAITNTVGRLAARGLVRVEPDPRDRRGKRIYLTEAGRAAREACIAALGPELDALEKAIGADALAGALPVLQAVRAKLDRDRDQGAD